VAVAVELTPYLVLDEEYCIVEVGPPAEAEFGPLRGQGLWDAFPDSRPLFEPYYERARQTGEPVEFVQFYNGWVGRVRAVPEGSRLLLFWEDLRRLDTLTLSRLHTSLEETLTAIAEQETSVRRDTGRDRLRVVDGGRR
jgi:hypothetical protein